MGELPSRRPENRRKRSPRGALVPGRREGNVVELRPATIPPGAQLHGEPRLGLPPEVAAAARHLIEVYSAMQVHPTDVARMRAEMDPPHRDLPKRHQLGIVWAMDRIAEETKEAG